MGIQRISLMYISMRRDDSFKRINGYWIKILDAERGNE